MTTNNSDIKSDNEQNDGNGNQVYEHDKDDYVGIIWRRFNLKKHSNWEYEKYKLLSERMIQTIAKSILKYY